MCLIMHFVKPSPEFTLLYNHLSSILETLGQTLEPDDEYSYNEKAVQRCFTSLVP